MNLNWRTRHLIPVKLSLLKSVRWNSIAYESVWNHMDECASSRETVSMVKGQRRQGRALAHKALHPRDWAMNCLHGHELSPCLGQGRVGLKGDRVVHLPTKRLIPAGRVGQGRGIGDRVGYLPIKRPIPAGRVGQGRAQRRQGRVLAHKLLHPHEYPFLFLTHSIEFFLTCLDTCLLFDRILRY